MLFFFQWLILKNQYYEKLKLSVKQKNSTAAFQRLTNIKYVGIFNTESIWPTMHKHYIYKVYSHI